MSELLCHCDGDHLGHELGLGVECPRIRPGMAPHTVARAQCSGVGKVPTETRYTPGKELASYLAVLAEENEERSA